MYGAFLNHNGGVIDDAIVFHMNTGQYMVVVNAGMGATIKRHLEAHHTGSQVTIADLTDRMGKIDIQGPLSVSILGSVLEDPREVYHQLPYFSFKGCIHRSSGIPEGVALKDGRSIMVSRTGYTGEIGFELFCDPDDVLSLWQQLMAAGEPLGMLPSGLAARDSLRTGAGLPLSHQDIGSWPFINNPWTFTLPYNKGKSHFTKTFIGAQALQNLESPQFTYPFVGNDPRKVSVTDPAMVEDAHGRQIGRVLTCATDMGIGKDASKIISIASKTAPKDFRPKGLSCGFVKTDCVLKQGQQVVLRDKRRSIRVTVVQDIRPDRTARLPLKKFTAPPETDPQ